MVVNLSPSPPLHSSSVIRLANSKSPISEPLFRLKTHFPKPLFSPSFASPRFNFTFKKHFLHGNSRNRLDFRTWSFAGFDYGNFEGPHKFAVGFGPILAKFNAKNVEYSIRAFPLGGFVGFPDNDPESDIPVDDENLLKNRPILDRLIVVSAGVVANIVFALAIIFAQVLSVGLPEQEVFPGVVVPDVRPFSAASRDGLLAGDLILEVNGSEFNKPGPNAVSEVVDVIKRNPKRYVLLKIKRGEQNFEVGVTPDENYDGTGKIGVQLAPNVKIAKVRPKNLVEAVEFTGKEFWEVARSNIDGLFQFAAILNINLAVINLLPLPALDGGTLALILIEAARGGRKLPLEVEQTIMSSGIMLVIILGLFLIVRDTLNLEFIKDLL
uniref:Zinc metalloprotease slr1821 family n=1 Tax=Cajanus cajan TaxID=3821 RepID=A0A151S0E1_CAJCA|nr:Putative zinc metalloprotease slr1821 family [Cajanus cajan]